MTKKESLTAMETALLIRNYSPRTRDNYLFMVGRFLTYCMTAEAGKTAVEYVNAFVMLLQGTNKEATTINLYLAAIRFLFEHVIKKPLLVQDVQYLKKPKNLPTVFSIEEIDRIFTAKINPKHRLLLSLYFGCGLRLSEAIHIKVKDISLDRGTIYIYGKGMKCRVINIKDFPQGVMRDHMIGKEPNDYLIESEQTGTAITKRTAQKVFENACRLAQVSVPWNIHRLRHTYATMLLEHGENIRHIQSLLGHSNIKTTMVYLSVSDESLNKIKSPITYLKGCMA